MTPWDYLNYYASLLLMQYKGLPKAMSTIKALISISILPQTSMQTISFSGVAGSGTFVLSYNGTSTAVINWNDSVSTIQSKLQAISGLSAIIVAGSIASQMLTVTFTGVFPPAFILQVSSNTLVTSGNSQVSISVACTDVPLPQAIQQAYNLNTAIGVQLDVIGKYCGVTRDGYNFSGPMTLTDPQFVTLIKMAILQNNSGSSLADIQNLIKIYFPGVIQVFDYLGMRISYFFDVSIGSSLMAEFFIRGNFLPKPMGVQLGATIYIANITNIFGFRTYITPGVNVSPFNSYNDYHQNWSWLSYTNAIVD